LIQNRRKPGGKTTPENPENPAKPNPALAENPRAANPALLGAIGEKDLTPTGLTSEFTGAARLYRAASGGMMG